MRKAAGYRGLSYAGYKGDVWNYNPDVIDKLTRKPSIDLDRGTLTYLEHTMDSLHIIEMEFDGIFTAFYNSCIDG